MKCGLVAKCRKAFLIGDNQNSLRGCVGGWSVPGRCGGRRIQDFTPGIWADVYVMSSAGTQRGDVAPHEIRFRLTVACGANSLSFPFKAGLPNSSRLAGQHESHHARAQCPYDAA